MKKPKKTIASEIYEHLTWARMDLPAGRVIHINGVPFWIEKPTTIKSHRENFTAAGLQFTEAAL